MGNETPPTDNAALDDLEPTQDETDQISGGHADKPTAGEPPMEETTDTKAGARLYSDSTLKTNIRAI